MPDETAFQALYLAIDDVRIWLWKHAADRPALAEGTFEETDAAWRIKTPQLDVRIQRVGLGLEVRTAAASWQFLPSADDDITFAGGAVSLSSAQRISAAPLMTGYSAGCMVTFESFPDRPGLAFRWTLSVVGNEIIMD